MKYESIDATQHTESFIAGRITGLEQQHLNLTLERQLVDPKNKAQLDSMDEQLKSLEEQHKILKGMSPSATK